MAQNKITNASEEQSRELSESSREDWQGRSFLKELFLGRLHMDWIDPFPEATYSEEFWAFYRKLEAFLEEQVDSVAIEEAGEYPQHVLDGLSAMGAFGMKIPKKYEGLGFSNAEYCKALELVGRHDGNLTALLSAHQSIGVPNPLKMFGTDEQKAKWLPICAKGGISAFALTEPDVGSDPARLGTTAVKDENGDWIINGTKLWITNSTIATVLIVMARNPETNRISAFIVPMDAEGVNVDHHCRFMGLKALANGLLSFKDVKVPKENLIGKEGAGLKIALITLNTGRLSIPAACVGGAKAGLEIVREWCNERVQWGKPVGKHEAITHKLAEAAAGTYAMEALSSLATNLSMREGYDIRLEAAASKEWVTVKAWDLTDDLMQIRGGRGYEEESSLKARGEKPTAEGRFMRDSRINRIFEGSSEIMHLFMAREMVDTHLKVAGDLIYAKSIGGMIKALPKIIMFYAAWYPRLWIAGLFRPSYRQYGELAKHVRFVESSARRLARNVFHGMVQYQAKLEKKQAFLFRTVDIAMELCVMAATVARTRSLIEARDPNANSAVELANAACLESRSVVEARFSELWNNHDDAKYAFGLSVLNGRHAWMEPERTYNAGKTSGSSDEAAAK